MLDESKKSSLKDLKNNMFYDSLYKNFKIYVDSDDDHMSEDEQQAALRSFEKPFNKRVFQMCIILLIWSVFGVTIDSFIIGGGVTAAIVTGPAWIQLLPTLIFSVLNWLVKWAFVYFYMRREVSLGLAFITGVQYVGFTLLLGNTLKNDPEFRRGLGYYIKYLRKKGIGFILNMLKKK